MVPLSLDRLTEDADAIVIGHCMAKRVYERGNMIWTEYTFLVYDNLKGLPLKEIKVRQPGGEIGEKGIMVAGTANFLPLEEDLLFLDKDKDGSRDLIGWSQGRFKVYYDDKTKTKYAFQQWQGVSFLTPSGAPVKLEPARVDLEQLKAQIKVIANKPKGK